MIGWVCASGWVLVLPGALGPVDFLKVDGTVLRAESGAGTIVDLRGTNIGGWLVQEGWMSPNGYGAIVREAWSVVDAKVGQEAVLDGDDQTVWELGGEEGSAGLVVDLSKLTAFDRLAMGTPPPEQMMTDLLIEVSKNGTHWDSAPIRSILPVAGEVRIDFKDVHTTRYVRLRWSGPKGSTLRIAEFRLLQNDDYTVRVALEQRFGIEQAQSLRAGYQREWFGEHDIDNIQEWGMNLLRIPMNWMQFVDEVGNPKPDAFERLDWAIKLCGERGIYVMLDMHAVPGGASPWASSGRAGEDGTGQNPNGFWTNPRYQEMTAEIWVRIAEHYRGNPIVMGYDLVNEPLHRFDETPRAGEMYSESALAKAAMYERLYRAVRKVDPDHIIVIAAYTVAPPDNTAYIGTPSGFIGITPPSYHGWTNVIYQTHHYDMTHPRDWQAQNRMVEEALKDIAHHQREWNVPIFAGEYSLYSFQDVWAKWMAGLNDLHASWTNWTYKVRGVAEELGGGDWGFFNTNLNKIPDMDRDSAEAIELQWQKFSTEHFQRNDKLIATVSRYARGESLESRQSLSRDDWLITTSGPGAGAALMRDGEPRSGWTFAGAQADDDWVQIDLIESRTFDGVMVETSPDQKEAYPVHFEISVSTDGQTWQVVEQNRGFGNRMTISFPRQKARHLRIARPGSMQNMPWNLAELNVWVKKTPDVMESENRI